VYPYALRVRGLAESGEAGSRRMNLPLVASYQTGAHVVETRRIEQLPGVPEVRYCAGSFGQTGSCST
jgi:hypothetical protein